MITEFENKLINNKFLRDCIIHGHLSGLSHVETLEKTIIVLLDIIDKAIEEKVTQLNNRSNAT